MPAPARPLVVRFGALGDLILVTPILRALAERHGAPCDVLGRGHWLPDLLRHLPWVGEVAWIDSLRSHRLVEPRKRAVVRWLCDRALHQEQSGAPGPVYLLQDDRHTRALLRAGRVGGEPVCERGLPPIANEHVVERYARLCGFADTGRQRVDPAFAAHSELRVAPEEARDCAAWLTGLGVGGAPVVLVQPGNRKTARPWWALGQRSAHDIKWWPSGRWAEVVRGIRARLPEARVLIIGSPAEQPWAEEIAALDGDARVLAVADQLPLRRLFALLARAHSLVSVDTGPAHAAAALDCPQVVLFGESDPRRNRGRARSAPVRVITGPPGAAEGDGPIAWAASHAMDGISAPAVLAAWEELAAG